MEQRALDVSTAYMGPVYRPHQYRRMIPFAISKILEIREKTPFDSLAFTGQSGAAIAYPVSAMTGIPLTCVRKDNDHSHHIYQFGMGLVEGSLRPDLRYAIVDDQICSGGTIRSIQNAIRRVCMNAKCVGAFLYYASHEWWPCEGVPDALRCWPVNPDQQPLQPPSKGITRKDIKAGTMVEFDACGRLMDMGPAPSILAPPQPGDLPPVPSFPIAVQQVKPLEPNHALEEANDLPF